MATLQRRSQPAPASRGVARHHSTTAEAAELERADVHAQAPFFGHNAVDAAFPAARRPMDTASVVALQRIHGNAHVQRLLAPTSVRQIQRNPDDEEEVRNDEVIDTAMLGDKEKASLYALSTVQGANWRQRYEANIEARRVIHQFNGCQGVHEDWTDALHLLETHEGKGFDAHKKVEGAKRAIGKSAKDQSGQYARERIQDYVKATKEADDQLRKLGEQRDAVGNAMTHVHSIMVKKQVHTQKQAVTKSEDEVKEEEERVKTQKEFIKGVFDWMSGLTDPKEWVKLVVNGAVFLGKQAVDAYLPSSKLDQLKKELSEAKQKLVSLEDAEIASQLKEAVEKLQAEQKKLVNAKVSFEALFGNLEMMQTTVVEVLGKSSATKGAAGAIKERGMVANAALSAEKKIQDYQALSGLLLGQIGKLETDYRTINNLAKTLAPNPSSSLYGHFTTVPARNVDTLHVLRNQINIIRSNSQDDIEYLATGGFLAGYDVIEESLESAVKQRND